MGKIQRRRQTYSSHAHTITPPIDESELYPIGYRWYRLQGILWVIPAVFVIVVTISRFSLPLHFENCYLEFLSWDFAPAVPLGCALIHTLEQPALSLHIPLILAMQYCVFKHAQKPEQLKKHMLVLLVITTSTVRCLSTYCG
jgi:hypothetical protein